VCDGDTNQCDRARIMFPAEVGAVNVILTNPDMLHCTLLPEVQRYVLSALSATYVLVHRTLRDRALFSKPRVLECCLYMWNLKVL
jgi:hypothetical protein